MIDTAQQPLFLCIAIFPIRTPVTNERSSDMALHNPNNWHWVNKDVTPWTKDYLETQLVGLKASDDNGTTVEISKIMKMEGDVDVSQRKGKVITIFDVELKLEWTGKVPAKGDAEGQENDTQEVSGSISIPEVAHDTEEDEYVVSHFQYFSRHPTEQS